MNQVQQGNNIDASVASVLGHMLAEINTTLRTILARLTTDLFPGATASPTARSPSQTTLPPSSSPQALAGRLGPAFTATAPTQPTQRDSLPPAQSNPVLDVLRQILTQLIDTAKVAPPAKTTEQREQERRDRFDSRAYSGLRQNLPNLPGGQSAVNIFDATQNARSTASAASQAMSGAGGSGLGNLAALGSAAGAAAGAVGAVATAAKAAVDALIGLVQAAKPYVEAYSPATVLAFNQAVRDMTATIGVALLPVIQTATTFVREFSAYLFPVAERLQPIFARLGEVFLSISDTALRKFAVLADAIIPLVEVFVSLVEVVNMIVEPIQELGTIILQLVAENLRQAAGGIKIFLDLIKITLLPLQMLTDAFRVIGVVVEAVIKTLQDVFASLTGVDLTAGMKSLREAFQGFLRVLINVIAEFAKAMGFTKFLTNLEASLRGDNKKKDATGLAAMENPNFTSFEEFGKQIAKAASVTLGEEDKKSTDDWLKQIATDIQQIREGDQSKFMLGLKEVIKTAIREATSAATSEGIRSAGRTGAFGLVGAALSR